MDRQKHACLARFLAGINESDALLIRIMNKCNICTGIVSSGILSADIITLYRNSVNQKILVSLESILQKDTKKIYWSGKINA